MSLNWEVYIYKTKLFANYKWVKFLMNWTQMEMQDVWQTAHCKNWMPILQITTLPKIQVKLSLVFSWKDDWIFGIIGEYRGYFIKNIVCCVLWPAFMCCTHPENSVQFKRFLSLILISKQRSFICQSANLSCIQIQDDKISLPCRDWNPRPPCYQASTLPIELPCLGSPD